VRLHLHTAHEEDAALRGLHTLPLPMADVRIALGELLRPGSDAANPASAAAGIVGTGEGEGGRQFPNRAITPPHARGVLSMVTVSPPTALLRSPAVTGLTKTYTANDFRALRQTSSARQNTSRLPSTHVDVRILFFSLFVDLRVDVHFFHVGVSVDVDFACHGAHAHSGPTSKPLWNGTWAGVWFLNTRTFFISVFYDVKLDLLTHFCACQLGQIICPKST
jgi:hypothetical protein